MLYQIQIYMTRVLPRSVLLSVTILLLFAFLPFGREIKFIGFLIAFILAAYQYIYFLRFSSLLSYIQVIIAGIVVLYGLFMMFLAVF